MFYQNQVTLSLNIFPTQKTIENSVSFFDFEQVNVVWFRCSFQCQQLAKVFYKMSNRKN